MRNKFYKLFLLSFSFTKGGAAIAAQKFAGIATTFEGIQVTQLSQDQADKFQLLKRIVSFGLSKLQFDSNPIKHSLNLFSYRSVIEYFTQHSDSLHHIHWINNDTVSVFDFSKIPKGGIITLHDEWLYCGTEHCYKTLDNTDYFEHGYPLFMPGCFGFPWNSLIWRIKLNKLSHRDDLIYTVPSVWMLERAKRSKILKNADVRLLSNPIDTDTFKPSTRDEIHQFRSGVGFSDDAFIFCFGAVGGKQSHLKGVQLLEKALDILHQTLDKESIKRVKILMFGGKQQGTDVYAGFEAYYLGHISNPIDLAKVYSSTNCVVVPSLVESFGQVAAEGLACETPVVSFKCSGLQDIVIDEVTGLCAQPFSVDSLADKLKLMLETSISDRKHLAKNGREHVVNFFSYPVVAEQYQVIINDAISLKEK